MLAGVSLLALVGAVCAERGAGRASVSKPAVPTLISIRLEVLLVVKWTRAAPQSRTAAAGWRPANSSGGDAAGSDRAKPGQELGGQSSAGLMPVSITMSAIDSYRGSRRRPSSESMYAPPLSSQGRWSARGAAPRGPPRRSKPDDDPSGVRRSRFADSRMVPAATPITAGAGASIRAPAPRTPPRAFPPRRARPGSGARSRHAIGGPARRCRHIGQPVASDTSRPTVDFPLPIMPSRRMRHVPSTLIGASRARPVRSFSAFVHADTLAMRTAGGLRNSNRYDHAHVPDRGRSPRVCRAVRRDRSIVSVSLGLLPDRVALTSRPSGC